MPWGGLRGRRGPMNLIGVVIAGTAGSLAGALFW